MSVTAFIHASVAYPNPVGQSSLILEKYDVEPFLYNVLDACINAENIARVIIVTSDNSGETELLAAIDAYTKRRKESVDIIRIPANMSYSYDPTHEKKREIAYPYLWRNYYGLFSYEGFKSLVQQEKVRDALIFYADSFVGLSSAFVDCICTNIQQKAIRYAFPSPYREILGVHVPFMMELCNNFSGKLKAESENKKKVILLEDVFRMSALENQQHFSSPHSEQFEDNAVFAYSKHDLGLLAILRKKDFTAFNTILKRYAQPIISEYVELEINNKYDSAFQEKHEQVLQQMSNELAISVIDEIKDTCLVLNFAGRSEPLKNESIYDYIMRAKDNGILSVWIETQANVLTKNIFRQLCTAGIDHVLIRADETLFSFEALDTLVKELNTVREACNEKEVYLTLQFSLTHSLIPKAGEYLEHFKSVVDRVLFKGTNPTGTQPTPSDIDFSPLRRIPCQKLFNSCYIKPDGNMRFCEFDLSDQTCSIQRFLTQANEQNNVMRLMQQHLEEHYPEDNPPCRTCREWYVPNLIQSVMNYQLFDMQKAETIESFDNVTHESVAQRQKEVAAAIDTIDCASAHLRSFLFSYQGIEKSLGTMNIATLMRRSLNNIRKRIQFLESLRRFFVAEYEYIGNAYLHFEEYEKALSAWEEVLKTNPAHKAIHEKLDELLAISTQ